MNLTSAIFGMVKLCAYITGCRSWTLNSSKEHNILSDGRFWVNCCYLVLIGISYNEAISRRSALPRLLTMIKLFVLIVALITVLNNIIWLRKRHDVDSLAAPIISQYCKTSRPALIFVPILIAALFINDLMSNEMKLSMICFFTTVINEYNISLVSLAVAESCSQIGMAVAETTPSSAKTDLPALIAAHKHLARFVTKLGSCYMLDYFLLSVSCFVRCMYLITDVIQDLNNLRATGEFQWSSLSTFVFAATTSGRFLTTCYAGSRLKAKSDAVLESLLSFNFYHYWHLDQKFESKVYTFTEQLQKRRVSLSVFQMFDLGLGTFASFVEVTVSYVIVVVNTIGSAVKS